MQDLKPNWQDIQTRCSEWNFCQLKLLKKRAKIKRLPFQQNTLLTDFRFRVLISSSVRKMLNANMFHALSALTECNGQEVHCKSYSFTTLSITYLEKGLRVSGLSQASGGVVQGKEQVFQKAIKPTSRNRKIMCVQ